MKEQREVGRVRGWAGITDDLIREASVHFDFLCEKYADHAVVEFRITDDGHVIAAVTN